MEKQRRRRSRRSSPPTGSPARASTRPVGYLLSRESRADENHILLFFCFSAMAPLILIHSLGTGAFHLNPRDKIGHGRGPSRSEGMSRVKSRRMAPNNSKSQGFYFSSWFNSRKNQPIPQTGLEYRRIKVILRHDGAVGTVLRSVRAASNYWRLSRHASCMYVLAWFVFPPSLLFFTSLASYPNPRSRFSNLACPKLDIG